MSLRRRLTFTMIALMVVGCVALASISLVIIDRTMRAQIDLRLATIADGEAQIVDDDKGTAMVDADDVAQMNSLHRPDEHVAVIDGRGRIIFGELVPSGAATANVRFVRIPILHPKNGAMHHLGTLVVWESDGWLNALMRTSILTFAAVTLALVGLAAFFSRRLAEAIMTPVERVASLAERIEGNDLSERLGEAGPDELGRLCASFDRMLERLQASFEKERRFAADASHELRAPLAVVRAETDLALRRDRSTEEYRAALESIDRETSRLELLVDQLLGTMRETTLVGDDTVDLATVVVSLASRMRSASQSMHVSQTGGEAIIRGHEKSIERALTAVLHNALTHGGAGHIEILVTTTEDRVRVDVVDDGAGFCEDALAHATERFWRGDTARSRGGTGLGLAIARVLVEVHGGEIFLSNTQHAGAATSLIFPRAGILRAPQDDKVRA